MKRDAEQNLVGSLQAGDLAGEQAIAGEIRTQRGKHLQSARLVFLAHIGDRQKNAGKGRRSIMR